MSLEALELVAAIAVAAVMMVPFFLARRIQHGEARFDSETDEPRDEE